MRRPPFAAGLQNAWAFGFRRRRCAPLTGVSPDLSPDARPEVQNSRAQGTIMFGKKSKPWTIMYKSVSHIEAASLIDTFGQILAVSTEKNSRDGITGFLAYDRGRFFQVLEGSRAAVTGCYARISGDPRHGQLETLIDECVAHRTFAQWSMGFVDAFDLDDYLTLQRGLHSDRPSDVFETMAQMGILDRMD